MSIQRMGGNDSRSSTPGAINVDSVEDEEIVPILGSGKVQVVEVHTTVQRGSGWFSSAFLVVNAALGAGLLNFPQAYHEAGGVLAAIIVQSIFLVFVVAAILILGYSSDVKKTDNYQDVVNSICGPIARLACAVSITVYCFGTCITFLIIIADQWELFFLNVSHNLYCDASPLYMHKAFIMSVTSVLFILPLCFPKRIDFLKYASVIGVIGILYIVALVTSKYFLPHPEPAAIATQPKSWMDVFLVVPDICFAYQCHVSIIPIYSCMEKRNLKEFSKTVTLAMILCVFTYTFTATLGYLQFGADIASDILVSFNPDAPVLVGVVLIAVKTYTTYPILLFCGRAGFNCIWSVIWKMSPQDELRNEVRRRIITTVVWFGATLMLAIFIPNIGVVIQVLGAFAAIFIFVFPGMCLLKIMQNKIESGEEQPRRVYFLRAFSLVFIVLGMFILGLTLSQAIMSDLKGAKPDTSAYTCKT